MLRDRKARGLSAPALDRRPDLEVHLVWVWNAFQQLSSCRQLGMSVGPIPWLAVKQYAEHHGIRDEDDFEEFRYLIAAMDETFMNHLDKRKKAEEQRATAATKKGGKR